ncbi:hypothetical protein LCGC14_2415940, partial [marine sediment metagenome]
MDYAAHHALCSERAEDGSTMREHWEVAAAQGSAKAAESLTAPPFPEDLAYMWDWTLELHGRSGVNMAGLNPLSYGT